MAKLVRARPKQPEYLPDWAKCCEWRKNFLSKLHERMKKQNKSYLVVDTTKRFGNEAYCSECNAFEPPGVHAVLEDGHYYSIELLDLDEGGEPYEA